MWLHLFLTLTLDKGDLSASRSSRSTSLQLVFSIRRLGMPRRRAGHLDEVEYLCLVSNHCPSVICPVACAILSPTKR